MEIWKRIDNSDYEVSNTGKVREVGRTKILRTKVNTRGCQYVCLYLNGRYIPKEIHILVSRAFLGEPTKPKLPIKHLDGNKLNNNIENLEYSTVKEMSLAYWRTGMGKSTPRHIVMQIRAGFPDTPVKQLAIEYKLTESAIRYIIRGLRCKFY